MSGLEQHLDQVSSTDRAAALCPAGRAICTHNGMGIAQDTIVRKASFVRHALEILMTCRGTPIDRAAAGLPANHPFSILPQLFS